MSVAEWSLFVGALLVTMVLAGTLLGRLPLSSAMVYLTLGWLLGPSMADVLRPDPMANAVILEHVAEVALLISLFAVGLQLGVPLRDRRWLLPLRLAFASMAAMVAMVAAVGVWILGLPFGAAVLLGAILAPTDPVLASGVQSEPGARPDRLGFSLSAEGGLNDGAAFPFAMLGLGLLGLYDMGAGLLRSARGHDSKQLAHHDDADLVRPPLLALNQELLSALGEHDIHASIGAPATNFGHRIALQAERLAHQHLERLP